MRCGIITFCLTINTETCHKNKESFKMIFMVKLKQAISKSVSIVYEDVYTFGQSKKNLILLFNSANLEVKILLASN